MRPRTGFPGEGLKLMVGDESKSDSDRSPTIRRQEMGSMMIHSVLMFPLLAAVFLSLACSAMDLIRKSRPSGSTTL